MITVAKASFASAPAARRSRSPTPRTIRSVARGLARVRVEDHCIAPAKEAVALAI
jgi:hypothetical protein